MSSSSKPSESASPNTGDLPQGSRPRRPVGKTPPSARPRPVGSSREAQAGEPSSHHPAFANSDAPLGSDSPPVTKEQVQAMFSDRSWSYPHFVPINVTGQGPSSFPSQAVQHPDFQSGEDDVLDPSPSSSPAISFQKMAVDPSSEHPSDAIALTSSSELLSSLVLDAGPKLAAAFNGRSLASSDSSSSMEAAFEESGSHLQLAVVSATTSSLLALKGTKHKRAWEGPSASLRKKALLNSSLSS